MDELYIYIVILVSFCLYIYIYILFSQIYRVYLIYSGQHNHTIYSWMNSPWLVLHIQGVKWGMIAILFEGKLSYINYIYIY